MVVLPPLASELCSLLAKQEPWLGSILGAAPNSGKWLVKPIFCHAQGVTLDEVAIRKTPETMLVTFAAFALESAM
jgi:hypothetical protein